MSTFFTVNFIFHPLSYTGLDIIILPKILHNPKKQVNLQQLGELPVKLPQQTLTRLAG
jgi:hypothetical protein